MGMIYGYARVSTDGQSVEAQVTALTDAGAEKVFREVASKAKTDRAPPCCMDRGCGRTEPDPCSGLCDADILWASEVQHSVQHVDGDCHLGRLTLVRLEAQPVTDDALPARDIRLHQSAPVILGHPLPAHAPALGNAS